MDVEIDVPELGPVKLDIAYGGMFYAIVDAKKLDLELLPHNGRRICRLGEMIKVACREQHPVNHPEFDYPGCDILVFTDLQRKDQGKMLGKNAVVMSNGRLSWDNPDSWTGMIDRSPCGTGTCAVMAQLHARGGLELSEEFVHESILGTHFVGELLEEVTIGPTSAPAEPPPEAPAEAKPNEFPDGTPGRKRRASRTGTATLPAARRRRTATSNWRPASGWAKRSGAPVAR
eukprot:g24902.t1